MAYRTFKRVLVETSLERKCLFLFGACLLLLITGSFWWYGTQTDRLVLEQNRRAGRGLVDAILAVRHWEALETNTDFKPLVVSIAENMRNQEYRWRTIKPNNPANPGSSGQPQDELEWELLEKWTEAGRNPEADLEELSSQNHPRHLPEMHEYQYYQPIYAKGNCLICHSISSGNNNLQQGDLLAIVQVSFDDAETVKAQHMNRAVLLTLAIVTVTLATLALYAIVKFVIVKPLKHLRDVSNEVRRGNTELRADIRTNDEFEELAVAFNRMLRHQIRAQTQLRTVNNNLDGKVDELAQANMRLYEMNRLKGDFLATVSHELRTPLNSILGFSDVLGSIDALDEKQRRYVENIRRSGSVLLEMINDILDLAKMESGKMDVRPSQFRIEQIIAAQCDMARPMTERKNIDLEPRIEEGLPEMEQDQAKVQQILNNLLSNAIKFTPEGGRVTVEAQHGPEGHLNLVVADTGVGISEDDQAIVFEKFRQGAAAMSGGEAITREYSGTGLGLSIVRELSRLLGGEVTLASELGKGSRFTVRLPWILPPRAPVPPELDQPPVAAAPTTTASGPQPAVSGSGELG